ncbi:rRNA methyltransferase SpoU family protein [Moraxella macacae 0408225]|uniref:tRNA (cytidine/uridine-2'-O-)-methyltransferase TrmJ n=1 Tax=Moraxella macacae 0408225 TaxID=1230338 RepID=L2F766_9GAMM|nr:RNA methyltransferase [Moraxella macacae]ELA08303.1 rRNA methyltransferase SpoU family protein [Moraxella macacae 0408225]
MNNKLTQLLDNIYIIMVNTTLPANIGSVARAMHTMGLRHLVLVKPKKPIDDDALALSAGGQAILHHCQYADTLTDAIADCQWVFATSSRQRHMPKPVLTPRLSAKLIINHFVYHTQQAHNPDHANQNKIAFVFGREDRGLTNDELKLADYHIQIPANPNYSVLNVAMAVQVIASVLYETAEETFMAEETLPTDNLKTAKSVNLHELTLNLRQNWDEPAINHAQKQQLEDDFLAVLAQLSLYDSRQPKTMPWRIARLFGRLQLDIKEFQLLQALLQAMLAKIKQANQKTN